MSRTINTVAYSLQGTTANSAIYGAVVSTIPTTARFQTLATRQAGNDGVRTSRVVTQKVAVEGGGFVDVVETHTSFVPNSVSQASALPARGILKALMAETSYDAGIAAASIE